MMCGGKIILIAKLQIKNFKSINILPVCTASVLVIASKMSAEGFSNPPWITLVLS